jgi:hypothetical protein
LVAKSWNNHPKENHYIDTPVVENLWDIGGAGDAVH